MKPVRLITLALSCALIFACVDSDTIDSENAATNDRGVALMGRYEYDEARDLFAVVVEQEPNWLDARVNLAIATLNRQSEGDEQLALDILQPVLEQDPDHLRALYVTALIHLYVGEPELAARDLKRVVDADPNDAYAAYFLGQSLLQEGNSADAAEWLVRATALDPYLRSAYYAAAQVLRGQGRAEDAAPLLADYQRFAPNPAARLASFSYRRMGPKADALAVLDEGITVPPRPAGSVFAEQERIDAGGWENATVTTADINGDGRQDLFATIDDRSGVFTQDADGTFISVDAHPLGTAKNVRAALWGDLDDDGLTDVVFCGPDGVDLWKQQTNDNWLPTALSTTDCRAGALFDADHDGDLDVFVTGAKGNELLSNNRDGSFRLLAESLGLEGSPGHQILIADLDADRDLDIVVLNAESPNDAWQNDRTWQYRALPGLDDLRDTPLVAITAADANADGHIDIYGLAASGDLLAWQSDGGQWTRSVLRPAILPAAAPDSRAELSTADFDGDGVPEILLAYAGTTGTGFSLLDAKTGKEIHAETVDSLDSTIAVALDAGSGPALIGAGADGLTLWPAGPGRYEFLTIAPTGRSEAEQMRSNASGIGTLVMLKTAGQWTTLQALDPHSGPGQSLSPLSIGLRGQEEAEFIELEWSDGVTQTEIGLGAGLRHEIAETQRQLASCPVVFAWNGEKYEFVSDVLGVGGMGFFVEPGVYAPPRPFEGYLLDSDSLAARDGRYVVKLTEPMEENAYLDAALIHVYDLPAEWSMVLDERMGVAGPEVTGRAITYRRALDPVGATAANGADVTDTILRKDDNAAPPGAVDHRFIGLLMEDQVVTLEFDAPINGDGLALVADGWIEYPYSQTVFAAWQADVRYRAATLEARGEDSHWVPVAVEFGYPAGMPRKMVLPIDELPPGTTALRLSSNLEIYWDRLQVIWEEPLEGIRKKTLAPIVARVAGTGFAKRTTGPQRLPHYDYDNRSPFWDAKYQRGFYTTFGDATELVSDVDGALAIFGGGEEIHLEYPAEPPPAAGTRRFFALDFRGWAKDMDLYTQNGDTVGPVPELDGMDAAMIERRDRLHKQYNVRFQEGLQ